MLDNALVLLLIVLFKLVAYWPLLLRGFPLNRVTSEPFMTYFCCYMISGSWSFIWSLRPLLLWFTKEVPWFLFDRDGFF